MADSLLERALGESFAVSIATAEALEKKILTDSRQLNVLWINVRTLARNYWGSYNKDNRIALEAMRDGFVNELQLIKSLETIGVEIYFYAPSYLSLKRNFTLAKLREPKTDNQKEYDRAENTMLKWAVEAPGLNVIPCDSKVPAINGSAFLFTHYPIDLLSRFAFEYVELLESSTGVSKLPHDWNTKINLPKDYLMMPFNELTMQVYGDKNKHFAAQSKGIRDALTQVAKMGSWKITTRKEKMLLDIKKLDNPTIIDMFKRMLYSKLR